jgi:polysaccharide export outer membrane protein
LQQQIHGKKRGAERRSARRRNDISGSSAGVRFHYGTTGRDLMSLQLRALAVFAAAATLLGGCESSLPSLPSVGIGTTTGYSNPAYNNPTYCSDSNCRLAAPPPNENPDEYRIGPGDSLEVTVWHNQDLSGKMLVRPDGGISMPIIGDVVAAGRTPTELAKDLQDKLKNYVQNPIVTVSPTVFVGPTARQIRVIGEAAEPKALPYRTNMTLLDVVIEIGGLSRYADGSHAVIVRVEKGVQKTYHVDLDGLVRDGDIEKNVAMQPGDVLIIPQRFF